MPDPIFARTRTPYDSYQDFWRLVELSGFPTCYADEIDASSAHTYIYTPDNGETINGWPDATARIIHYQLEWCTHPNDQNPMRPGVSERWTMDQWHARRIGAQYVPIGSHPGLVYEPLNGPQPKDYDLALLAYMSFRRQTIAGQLENKGMRLAPNAWGEQRHTVLTHSKAMLHIHQHDGVPGVAALRLAVGAAYKMPVITETCADYGIFNHRHLLSCDFDNLADFSLMWVHRNESRILEDYGMALYQLLCVEKTFRKCIEAAL